jgi:hypothetical protein
LECLRTKAELKANAIQKNQGDGCEAVVGDGLPLSGGGGLFGTVPASVEKSEIVRRLEIETE